MSSRGWAAAVFSLWCCACPDTSGGGVKTQGPWAMYYGDAAHAGDLDRLAQTYRFLSIDADPDLAAWTDNQLVALKAGGRNQVISYLNLGSCEDWRTYWTDVPAGFVSCAANTSAQRGPYAGYPSEVWMDLGDAAWQELLLGFLAPRLAARPIDGFFLDNMSWSLMARALPTAPAVSLAPRAGSISCGVCARSTRTC